MASRTIKTVFAIDGETKYTSAIKRIKDEQKLLNAEVKSGEALYGLAGDKMGALNTKVSGLSKQIELQRKIVDEAKNAVKQAEERYKKASENLDEYTASGRDNKEEQQALKNELQRAEAAVAKYKKEVAYAEIGLSKMQSALKETTKELALSESALKKAGDSATEAGKKLETTGKKLNNIGNKMTIGLTVPIVAAAGASVKAAMDYESAFAGVRKTVDASEEELSKLSDGIREMAAEIPAAATDIAAVAEAAGQLGIQNKNIIGFTRTMIDLGEATNLSADEAASSLAKFANITQMSQKDFDRLGSAIVALGNNMATTESDIVSMGMRLAGAGKQVGMSESDIIAMAAALSSVGIEAEAGGSAFSKVMIEMQLAVSKGGEKLKNFASVAGMSATDFSKKFKDDAAGAINSFITGLGKMDSQGKDAIGVLDDMGITEVRLRDALLRSSGAGDVLAQALNISSSAWKENNALTKEAEQRYGTTESKIKIAQNRIKDAGITIGEKLLPYVADAAEWVGKAATAFSELSPQAQKVALVSLAVVAGIGPVTKVFGSIYTAVGKVTGAIGKYLIKLAEKKAAEAAATVATEGLSSSLSGSKGLTASLSGLGPKGLAIAAAVAGIALLAGYIYSLDKDIREMQKRVAETPEAMQNFADGVGTAASALKGFDESTVWATDNQEKLKKKVDEAQAGITKITDAAVKERRIMTEGEYARLQKLIDQLGAFADGQIEAYQQKTRILESMANRETNMTESRAQELIKAADETAEEIISIADAQRIKEYQVADDIRQNAVKLREQGRNDLAAIEAQRAKDIEKRADAEYKKIVAAERKKQADVIAAVQESYIKANQVEIENIKKYGDLQAQKDGLQEKYAEEYRRRTEGMTANDRTSAAEMQRIWDQVNSERLVEESKINKEMAGLWSERTTDVAGAMAQMAADIKYYGGEQSTEAQKVVQNIVDAYKTLPEKTRATMGDAVDGMLLELDKAEGKFQGKGMALAKMLVKGLRGELQIASPSKVMRAIGRNVTESLSNEVEAGASDVAKAGRRIAGALAAGAGSISGLSFPGLGAVTTIRHTVERTGTVSPAPAVMPQRTIAGSVGGITLPVYVNGEFVGRGEITAEELSKIELSRTKAEGVTVGS